MRVEDIITAKKFLTDKGYDLTKELKPLKVAELMTEFAEKQNQLVVSDKKLEKLLALKDEVLKVWNEDGEDGEIQMKTPIAWYRVLRIAENL